MSPIPEDTKALAKKWDLNPSKQPDVVAAIICENMEKWLEEVKDQVPDSVADRFGEDWRDKLYSALKKAWQETCLHELCCVQPVTSHLASISYLASSTSGAPATTPRS